MTDVRGQTRPAMSGSWKSAFILTTAVMTYSARASHFLPSHPWAMSGLGLTGGVFTGIFALAASSTTVKAVGPSASDEIARIAARKIQISFVRQVDKSDNGIIEPSPTDLNRVLGSFNAGVKTTEERDFQFGQALSITQTILLNIIVQTVSAAIDEEKVKAAIAEQAPSMDRHYGILRLPAPAAWRTAVVNHNHSAPDGPRIVWVISPNSDGKDWGLTGVPVKNGSLAIIAQLPEDLAARTPEEFATAFDPDLTFVHRGQFYAAGKTPEVLEKLAKSAANS